MKRFTTTLAIIAIAIAAVAQDSNDDVSTLFGGKGDKKDISHGGYGGIMLNYTTINDQDALTIGARGAWVIDHSFGIGLGGYGFMADPKQDIYLENKEYSISGGYGGLILEPIIAGKFPVHLSFPVLIGAGGIAYTHNWQHYNDEPNYNNNTTLEQIMDNEYNDDNDYQTQYESSDAFFVVEPGVELEFNMLKFLRIALTASYRYTSNINMAYKLPNPNAPDPNIIGSQDMLNGYNFGMALKFGKF